MTYCISMMQGSSSCDVEVYAKLERERIEIKVKNSNTKGEKHYTSKTKAPTKAPQKKDNFVARLDYDHAKSSTQELRPVKDAVHLGLWESEAGI